RRDQQREHRHFSFRFRGIGNPGAYDCRFKKRTGLGPHPPRETTVLKAFLAGMSGVLNLESNPTNKAFAGFACGTLSLPKMSSGANAFEISDFQEGELWPHSSPGDQNRTMLHCVTLR